MGTEALAGTRGSYDPFIHDIARPHPGQARNLTVMLLCYISLTFHATGRGRAKYLELVGR